MLPGGPIRTGDYTRSSPEGTPLPLGNYRGIPVKQTLQDLDNDGQRLMLTIEFDITFPEEYSNRKFWDKFNLVNPSADAMRISKEALADLGAACGLAEINEADDLLNNEVQLELVVEKGKPYKDKHTGTMRDGKDSNKCKKYWQLGVDIEAAKKAAKDQKGGSAPSAPAQSAPAKSTAAQKWGGQKPATATPPVAAAVAKPAPAAAPAQAAQPEQAASQPAASAGPKAPWKRNKQ